MGCMNGKQQQTPSSKALLEENKNAVYKATLGGVQVVQEEDNQQQIKSTPTTNHTNTSSNKKSLDNEASSFQTPVKKAPVAESEYDNQFLLEANEDGEFKISDQEYFSTFKRTLARQSTQHNPWDKGTFVRKSGRMVTYDKGNYVDLEAKVKPWYFMDVEKSAGVGFLEDTIDNLPEGTFVICESSKEFATVALLFEKTLYQTGISHHKEGLHLTGSTNQKRDPYFPNLSSLVSFYERPHKSDILPLQLVSPPSFTSENYSVIDHHARFIPGKAEFLHSLESPPNLPAGKNPNSHQRQDGEYLDPDPVHPDPRYVRTPKGTEYLDPDPENYLETTSQSGPSQRGDGEYLDPTPDSISLTKNKSNSRQLDSAGGYIETMPSNNTPRAPTKEDDSTYILADKDRKGNSQSEEGTYLLADKDTTTTKPQNSDEGTYILADQQEQSGSKKAGSTSSDSTYILADEDKIGKKVVKFKTDDPAYTLAEKDDDVYCLANKKDSEYFELKRKTETKYDEVDPNNPHDPNYDQAEQDDPNYIMADGQGPDAKKKRVKLLERSSDPTYQLADKKMSSKLPMASGARRDRTEYDNLSMLSGGDGYAPIAPEDAAKMDGYIVISKLAFSFRDFTYGVSFRPNQHDEWFFAGLSCVSSNYHGGKDSHYDDIDFAIFCMGIGKVTARENEDEVGPYVPYDKGDLLEVRINKKENKVEYVKNGTVFYRSLKKPNYPLNIVQAFHPVNGGQTLVSEVKWLCPPIKK